VDEAGFDGTAKSQGKTQVSTAGAAKSGAVESQNHPEAADADLAKLIAAWPRLVADAKAAILAIVESATR